MLEAGLRDLGCEIVGAAVEPYSVLDLLRRTEPDVVLMDARLAAGHSGGPTAALLQALRSVVVVCLVSPRDVSMLDAALEAAPVGFLFEPLRDGELRGVLGIARRRADELRALADGAREVAEARERLAVALSELARQTREDPLTGIGNRRALDEALRRECLRIQRSGGSLGLLLISPGWFGAFHEHHGRQTANECLRMLAVAISPFAGRATDLIARHGDDVFAVLLPDTATRGVLSQMEGLVDEVRDLAIPNAGSPDGRVTVSIGAAVTSAHARTSWEQLTWEAEQALARARRRGRDGTAVVVVSDGERPSPRA